MAVVISNTIIYLLFIFLGGFLPSDMPSNGIGETDVALYVSWFNWIMEISKAFQTLTNLSEKYILQNDWVHACNCLKQKLYEIA